jgi:hypothetical protein
MVLLKAIFDLLRSVRIGEALGLVLALAFVWGPQEVVAQTVTINLSTGVVGQTGTTLIPIEGYDDDWQITFDPVIDPKHVYPTAPPARAAVVVPTSYSAHIKWSSTLANSRWISGRGDSYMNLLPTPGPTVFTYEACFNLPPQFTSPVLTMQMRADDIVRQVLLNSTSLYLETNPKSLASATKAGSFAGPPLAITYKGAGFQVGKNCVDVGVNDEQQMITGLNVVATVTYQGPCPKSGTIVDLDYRTGTTNGVKNALTAVDPKWTLIAEPSAPPGPAYSTGAVAGAWIANPPVANWIERIKNANPPADLPGVYKYQALMPSYNPGLYSSVTLTMKYAADNSANILLNNVLVPGGACAGPVCYNAWQPVPPQAFPASGSPLEVDVTNINGPTGLIVDATLAMVCK